MWKRFRNKHSNILKRTKTSSNKYANTFERLKCSQTDCEYIWGQSLNNYLNIFEAQSKNVENIHLKEDTSLHRSLSKYLTRKDTCSTPTLIKNNRTLDRLGSNHGPQYKYIGFSSFCPLYWVNLSKKTKYTSELVTRVFIVFFPKTKQNNTVA